MILALLGVQREENDETDENDDNNTKTAYEVTKDEGYGGGVSFGTLYFFCRSGSPIRVNPMLRSCF